MDNGNMLQTDETQEKPQYFFFLAEYQTNSDNIFSPSFIGQPIPVAKSIAQLFLNISPHVGPNHLLQDRKVETQSASDYIPENNCSNQLVKNTNNLCNIKALSSPPKDNNNNSIVPLMESLMTNPSPYLSNDSKAYSNKNKEKTTSETLRLYNNLQSATDSDSLKSFLPFRPSQHQNIFGDPSNVPFVGDDIQDADSDNGSDIDDEDRSSGSHSDNKKREREKHEIRSHREKHQTHNQQMNSNPIKTNARKMTESGGERLSKRKPCVHKGGCQTDNGKKGSNNAYFSGLARIFSSTRINNNNKN